MNSAKEMTNQEEAKSENTNRTPMERRPRKIILPDERYDDQIVELLNKGFMEDPVSGQLWPDPAMRVLGHRAMFYAHLANQRLQNTSSTSTSPQISATFVNAVIEDDDTDSIGVVRAASIWTTPEGPKATLNSLYYGFKYLGLIETMKWAKFFLYDFHQVVDAIFDEITQIRRKKRKNKQKLKEAEDRGSANEVGGGREGGRGVCVLADGGGVVRGGGSSDGAVGDGGEAAGGGGDSGGGDRAETERGGGDVGEEELSLAFPDFIAADAQIRGQGYGADVMSDGLQRCKQAGKTVYILSSNAKNLTFYKKLGFSVYVEKMFIDVPLFGLAPSEK